MADAAIDYAAAGLSVRAAWLAVHQLGDVAVARSLLVAPSAATAQPAASGDGPTSAEETHAWQAASDLLRRVILARCDVAADADPGEALATLDDVMVYLERHFPNGYVPELESWAVAVAEAMSRPDLVALIFAAAVRGGHIQAAERWDTWSRHFLEVPLQLPDAADDATARAAPLS
jgi:hypothetical protein